MYWILSLGYSFESGTKAAPAFKIPKIEMIIFSDLSSKIGILSSSFIPLANKVFATLLALAFKDLYVNFLCLNVMATSSGCNEQICSKRDTSVIKLFSASAFFSFCVFNFASPSIKKCFKKSNYSVR